MTARRSILRQLPVILLSNKNLSTTRLVKILTNKVCLKRFSPQFSSVYSSGNKRTVLSSFCCVLLFTNFRVLLLLRQIKISLCIFCVNLIFFLHLNLTLVERNTFVGLYHIFIWFFPPLTNVKTILKPWPPRAFQFFFTHLGMKLLWRVKVIF